MVMIMMVRIMMGHVNSLKYRTKHKMLLGKLYQNAYVVSWFHMMVDIVVAGRMMASVDFDMAVMHI